jgi:hypothetical protein
MTAGKMIELISATRRMKPVHQLQFNLATQAYLGQSQGTDASETGSGRHPSNLPSTETLLRAKNGSAGARTQDLRIKSPVLYRLSYAP